MARFHNARFLAIVAVLLFSGYAQANTVFLNMATVRIYTDGGSLYIESNGAFCGGRFARSMASGGKEMMSMAMAAKLAGKTLTIVGSNACDYNSSETIAVMYF